MKSPHPRLPRRPHRPARATPGTAGVATDAAADTEADNPPPQEGRLSPPCKPKGNPKAKAKQAAAKAVEAGSEDVAGEGDNDPAGAEGRPWESWL